MLLRQIPNRRVSFEVAPCDLGNVFHNPKRERGDCNTEKSSLTFRVGKNAQLQNA